MITDVLTIVMAILLILIIVFFAVLAWASGVEKPGAPRNGSITVRSINVALILLMTRNSLLISENGMISRETKQKGGINADSKYIRIRLQYYPARL